MTAAERASASSRAFDAPPKGGRGGAMPRDAPKRRGLTRPAQETFRKYLGRSRAERDVKQRNAFFTRRAGEIAGTCPSPPSVTGPVEACARASHQGFCEGVACERADAATRRGRDARGNISPGEL